MALIAVARLLARAPTAERTGLLQRVKSRSVGAAGRLPGFASASATKAGGEGGTGVSESLDEGGLRIGPAALSLLKGLGEEDEVAELLYGTAYQVGC
jgi:hypothetical protein